MSRIFWIPCWQRILRLVLTLLLLNPYQKIPHRICSSSYFQNYLKTGWYRTHPIYFLFVLWSIQTCPIYYHVVPVDTLFDEFQENHNIVTQLIVIWHLFFHYRPDWWQKTIHLWVQYITVIVLLSSNCYLVLWGLLFTLLKNKNVCFICFTSCLLRLLSNFDVHGWSMTEFADFITYILNTCELFYFVTLRRVHL